MIPIDIYISVVVPADNEAERLPSTLRRLHNYLAGGCLSYEILVLLDGPTDSTRDVLRSLSAEIHQVRIIDRAVNRGKGFTVREGMLEARGRIRLFTDADNSTDIAHFDRMKPSFDEGCDLVIASRNPKDVAGACQTVPQRWYKRSIGKLGNLLVQRVAVPGIWDTQCGFKAFRAEAAEPIFSRLTIDRWGFDIEVLALARALNYKIGIIPAHWINDDQSHVKLPDYLRVLRDTFKVRANLLMGKYGL
ncbi:MAG: glycosyltransferase family 2 protein [Deltaproteobacteria bacterium]|nr:glycosyltransferase family 2 protein [Deltaproteobacteria bacterium]MDZ4341619.1 dolichyl-phosphate beta-glucosyltransferase [Candidatus Binatia bacterium]